MKYPCETVKDLLPLYYDNVCSESSKKIVEEHLAECESCRNTMKIMKDNTYETCLQEEREHVVEHHAKAVKRKSVVVGMGLAAVLTIPILVCLIVNLATGHGLSWFFVVLTSLLVFASVTVVPLVVEEKRSLWTLGSFTVTVSILLLTCNIYSGGNWFMVAWVSMLLGLAVVFLPFVMRQMSLPVPLSRHKGLLSMVVDTVLLYAVIVVCGFFGGGADYWKPALLITTQSAVFAWVLFGIIRYTRTNAFIKAGICTVLSGVLIGTMNDFINWAINGVWHFGISDMNLLYWNSDKLINANCYFLSLLAGCIVGGILLVVGVFCKGKK